MLVFGISFVIILAVMLAGMMILRDVNRPATAGADAELSLRRPYTPPLASPKPGAFAWLDHRFVRLVYDARLGIDGTMASLLVAGGGLVLGGITLLVFDQPIAAIIGAVVGMVLGIGIIAWRRARRFRDVQQHLPDAIDAISRAVHAGESVEEAIESVSRQTPGELGKEFLWCSRQMRLGSPVDFTMRALADRVPVLDIRLLASVLTVHRRTGGNLAATLESLSQVCRQRMDYRRQMRATTSAGRLSAWMVGAAGPVVFLILFFFFPEHIAGLFERDWGTTLFAIGVVLEIVGLVWINRLLRISE